METEWQNKVNAYREHAPKIASDLTTRLCCFAADSDLSSGVIFEA